MKLTHRAVAVAAAVTLGLLGSTAAASAQDDTGPDSRACIDAKAAVSVALAARDEAKVPSDLEQQAATTQANLDAAVAAYHRLGDNLPAPTREEGLRLADRLDDADVIADLNLQASIHARSDAIVDILALTGVRDAAAAVLETAVEALAEAQAALDAALRVQAGACDEPDPTPTPTPTPEPEPGPNYDCADFPLPDGRTAQDVLDADPNDPHVLDANENGIACEPAPDGRPDDGDDFDQIGTPPAGGVDTGGGPA